MKNNLSFKKREARLLQKTLFSDTISKNNSELCRASNASGFFHVLKIPWVDCGGGVCLCSGYFHTQISSAVSPLSACCHWAKNCTPNICDRQFWFWTAHLPRTCPLHRLVIKLWSNPVFRLWLYLAHDCKLENRHSDVPCSVKGGLIGLAFARGLVSLA